MPDFSFTTEGPIFQGAHRHLRPGSVVLFGAGYDGTVSFRPGSRFGPDALRTASPGLETYSPDQDADYEELVDLVDLGNLDLPTGAPEPVRARIEAATNHILASDARPFLLGGEHGVSIGAIQAVAARHPDLTLIQIDAHADLRPDYLGDPLNHACVLRRALDILPHHQVLQVGIRSGTKQEFHDLRHHNRLVPPSPEHLARRLAHTSGPIYLTVDVDAFDPAFMPGTGTPEPGGIDWPTFAALLATIPPHRLIAADVVELAPLLDPSGISSVLAAKIVREILLRLA